MLELAHEEIKTLKHTLKLYSTCLKSEVATGKMSKKTWFKLPEINIWDKKYTGQEKGRIRHYRKNISQLEDIATETTQNKTHKGQKKYLKEIMVETLSIFGENYSLHLILYCQNFS